VTAPKPQIVAWSDHARAKAELLGIAGAEVEDAILAGHSRRTRNAHSADWLLKAGGRLAIAYNHPDRGDELGARVVTLWRQG
jgi:hypothetical protein